MRICHWVQRHLGSKPKAARRAIRQRRYGRTRLCRIQAAKGSVSLRAIGGRREKLAAVDVTFCAEIIAWILAHFDDAPSILNILAPELPTKQQLVTRLREYNPGLRVIWLPRVLVRPLSWLAIVLQKSLHPRKPAINAARVFAQEHYDTVKIASVVRQLDGSSLPPSRSTRVS